MQCWSPFAVGANNIFSNEILQQIANSHNKTIAQVILRWHMQRGCIVIPKSVRIERMKENIDIFDFKLSASDMKEISTLNLSKPLTMSEESEYRLASLKRVFKIK